MAQRSALSATLNLLSRALYSDGELGSLVRREAKMRRPRSYKAEGTTGGHASRYFDLIPRMIPRKVKTPPRKQVC
jgi:hypothetical protein